MMEKQKRDIERFNCYSNQYGEEMRDEWYYYEDDRYSIIIPLHIF